MPPDIDYEGIQPRQTSGSFCALHSCGGRCAFSLPALVACCRALPTTKDSSPSGTIALTNSSSVDFSLGVLLQQEGSQSITIEGMGDLQTGCPMLVAEATQECSSLLPWVWNMLSGSFHICTVMC